MVGCLLRENSFEEFAQRILIERLREQIVQLLLESLREEFAQEFFRQFCAKNRAMRSSGEIARRIHAKNSPGEFARNILRK